MNEKTFRQTLRRAFWVPFVIGAVLAAILILEVRFLINRAAWVEHTDQAITLSQRMYRSRIDQETGLRAYMLTRDKRFLEPFYDARKQNLAMEPELRRLVADNPEQVKTNEQSFQAFEAWSAWADEAIAITAAGKDAGDVSFQFRGKELMDRYRRFREDFIDRERQLRDERVGRSRRALQMVNASIVVLAMLFGLGFALLGRRQLKSLSQSFTAALDTARERGDWLQTTLTSIGDAVITTDADGNITLMNGVAEKLTGWPMDEARRKPLGDIFRIINQETRQAVENPVEKVRRLKGVVGLANHTILVSKAGQEIAIDDSGAPIFASDGSLAGIVLVFRDVTAQRAADAILNERRTELETVISSTPFMLTRCSRDLRYRFISEAYAHLLNRQAKEVQGKPIVEIMGEEGFTAIRPYIEKVLRGERVFYESEVPFKNVGTRVLQVTYTPDKDEHGNIVGWIASIVDVTERRQIETALNEAQNRFNEVVDSIHAVVWDADPVTFQFKYVSRGAEAILGYPRERWLEPNFWSSIIHPEDRGRTMQLCVNATHQGRDHTLEYRAIAADGRVVWLLDRVYCSLDADGRPRRLSGVMADITERKQAEAKVAEQAGLLDLASDAIIVRDEPGNIAYWNKGAEQLYGWTQDEALGRRTSDLLQTQFPQPFLEILDRIRKEKYWQGELVQKCKGGEQVTTFSRWAPVHGEHDGAASRSFMEINTDITQRKQLEAALRSNERLALAGRLSASIAHEIHNPLDTVGNILFLLGERLDSEPEIEQLIKTGQNEVQRVAEISKNMLSLHRESRAATKIKLSELLEGVVMLIEETVAKGRRNIQLVPGFEGEVEAFPSELRQVFTNVIKNAVEATAEGGEIKIYSEAAQESDRPGVQVRVVDNGVGIPEKLKSRLFNPFVSTKEESGTGLGLWVSRSILEKHRGTIRLTSDDELDGRRTTALIFLPLQIGSRKKLDDDSSRLIATA